MFLNTSYNAYKTREKFSIFYGDEESAKQEAAENNEAYYRPWHCGWNIERDGGWAYSDEWESANSWTAKKIVRPSYSENTAVKLVLHISGAKTNGKLRAKSWHASLEIGHFFNRTISGKSRGTCKSLVDACRKAEQLPELQKSIDNLLREIYSPTMCKAIFKKNKEGAYTPLMSSFRFCDRVMEWESGEYIKISWERRHPNGMQLCYGKVERSYWGYSSGSGTREEGEAKDLRLKTWLAEPKS